MASVALVGGALICALRSLRSARAERAARLPRCQHALSGASPRAAADAEADAARAAARLTATAAADVEHARRVAEANAARRPTPP